MMKKNILLLISIILMVTGCGGGGGGGGGVGPNPPAPPAVNLVPLKIAMLDLNNNPIPYFDISKIGSHPINKLKFTNLNNISVLVYNFGTADYYSYVQAQKIGISIESYDANYQPASYEYDSAIKTTNADDCFNHMENGTTQILLASGDSCSYYSYSINLATNYTNKNTFTIPVSYTISVPDSPVHLDVVQCTQSGMPPNPTTYDCSNMSKPGFSEQFITYKVLPINGGSNFIPANPFGHRVSQDGNWYWSCTTDKCNKYALSYNSASNTLTQSMKPTTIAIKDSGKNILDLYPAADGSNVWVSSYTNMNGFSIVNTANPNMLLNDDCYSGHCVPDMDTDIPDFANGVVGLDGSFWWNTLVKADIYDPINQTFIRSNILAVIGVNADGTVIGFANGQASCFDRGTDYTSYAYRGPLLNYVVPYEGTISQNYGQNVYMQMDVPDIVDYSGRGLGLKAYYKVHTENGQCQINLDDYTYAYINNATDQYLLSIAQDYITPFMVTAFSNVYSGL